MRVVHLVFVLIALLAVAIQAENYAITLLAEKSFNTIIASDVCKTDQGVVVNYKLTKKNLAYVTSTSGNLQGTACGQQLLAKPAGGAAASSQITKLDNDDGCGTKCGGPTCLCLVGMTCTQTGTENPCEEISTCTNAVCVARTSQLTQITYRYPKMTSDPVESQRFQRAFRDAISKYGIDSHCWTQAYVYDVPLNKDGNYHQISFLDNKVSTRGCGAVEFAFPLNLIPKSNVGTVDPDQVQVIMKDKTQTISLECLDQETDLLTCGSTCFAPCPANTLCTKNEDCIYGDCKQMKNTDGETTDEKRCNNAISFSIIGTVVVIAIVALFF